MKMKVVYLISGETGEYSDREEWPVAVFTKKEKAEEWKLLCEGAVKGSEDWNYTKRNEASSPYDSALQVDSTGTYYSLIEVLFNPAINKGEK